MTGGKQAILKRADHRFIERIEFVSHNGRTSFPQLRALGEYHECAERCKSFSKNIAEKFLQPRMPRPAHVALWLSEGGYTPRCRCEAEPHPGCILLADISNGVVGSYLPESRRVASDPGVKGGNRCR